jgi:hypothetical protein
MNTLGDHELCAGMPAGMTPAPQQDSLGGTCANGLGEVHQGNREYLSRSPSQAASRKAYP